jgi:phage shock protein A
MLDKSSRKRGELSEMEARNEHYRVSGEFRHGNELGEAELSELQHAIMEFHTVLGFDAASSNDTTTMLARIESKMEEMTYKLSRVDPKLLKELAQLKELERRNQERTEKNLRDKKEQEEKTQKAIQLAMMPIKRRTGRPLIERTIPRREDSRDKREEALRRKLAQEAADADLLYGAIWD